MVFAKLTNSPPESGGVRGGLSVWSERTKKHNRTSTNLLVVIIIPAIGVSGAGRAGATSDFLLNADVVDGTIGACADDALVLQLHYPHLGL